MASHDRNPNWPRARAALEQLTSPSDGQRMRTMPDEQPPERDLVGETTRALARWLAHVTAHESPVPVLYVAEAPFGNGVALSISARLSPAAVDRLLNAVDALDR